MQRFFKHIVCNQRFRGSIRDFKNIVAEDGRSGTWIFNSPYYQFETSFQRSCIRWWPDTGDIQFVHDASDTKPRLVRNMQPPSSGGEPRAWGVLSHKRRPDLSVPEYFFFDPHAFLMRVGLTTFPAYLRIQATEVMRKARAVQIPNRFDCPEVVHKFVDDTYCGFEIVPRDRIVGRERGRFIVDDRIDVYLPGTTYVHDYDDEVRYHSQLTKTLRRINERSVEPIRLLFGAHKVWDRSQCGWFFENDENFLPRELRRRH